MKSRQLGFTTEETIDSLDDTLFTPNLDCLIIAHEKQEAIKIFDNKIDFAWSNFHPQLKKLWYVDTETKNTLKFKFPDGSASSISVATSGRSGTYHRVHISEFGKICKEKPQDAKEIIEGTIPAIPLSGRLDIESTAEGAEGAFHDMFWEAWNRGEPKRSVEFKAHFYNWTWDLEEIQKVIPEKVPKEFQDYQKKYNLTDQQITYYYFKFLSLNKDWNSLHQEYPTTPEEAFISAGDRLFASEKLARMQERVGTKQGDWIYYADYIPGHRYALGCDPSEGVGRNNSAIEIIDFDAIVDKVHKPEVVATFASNRITPDQLAYEVRNGGTRYGNCLAAVERNNHGHAVLSVLKRIYFNLYIEEKREQRADEPTEKLGWHTNLATKPKMIYDLNTAVNEELLNVPDAQTNHELKTYPRQELDEIKFDDEKQQHWDRVMALAIAWQMRNKAIPSLPYDDLTKEEESRFDKFGLLPEY